MSNILEYLLGGFPNKVHKDMITEDCIATATSNAFIPIINLRKYFFIGETIAYPKTNMLGFEQKIRLKDISDSLTLENVTNSVTFKEDNILKKVITGKGIMVNEVGDILFLAAIKSEVFVNFIKGDKKIIRKSDYDIEDFKIFISNKFPTYKKVYNKIKKDILDDYIKEGFELSIMDSKLIEKSVYSNRFENTIEFNTVEDSKSFIEFFKSTIL